MTYLKFKQILREYCKEFDVKFPDLNTRHILYREYETLCLTAVEDNDITLGGFLDSANWAEMFNEKRDTPMPAFCLAPLPKAVPQVTECKQPPSSGWWGKKTWEIKEEGITPMRYNDNYASASVQTVTPKSDYSVTRDYLLSRLEMATYPKRNELGNLFNLNVDNSPKTYKELIDIIKNGKYTIDAHIAKKIDAEEEDTDNIHWGSTYGIIWPGPVEDLKGYRAAIVEMDKQVTAARDVIMTDAPAALSALQAFEAWLPTPGTIAS